MTLIWIKSTKPYITPPTYLANYKWDREFKANRTEIKELQKQVLHFFSIFKVSAKITNFLETPVAVAVVFDIDVTEASDLKKLKSLKTDLEVHLGHYIELVPSSDNIIKLCIKAHERSSIGLRSILESQQFQDITEPCTFVLGQSISGEYLTVNIADAPHVFIGGTTGAGKTMLLDNIIVSMLYKSSPDDLRMILIDPKIVDLKYYAGIPHLLGSVITDTYRAMGALHWAEDEIQRRMNTFAKAQVRDIDRFNAKNKSEKLPRIIIIIDEYHDLIKEDTSEFITVIKRIAYLGRAAGIHMIITTQSGRNDSISSEIKANLPYRIMLAVTDKVEMKAIVDKTGLPKLLGNGDMFVQPPGNIPSIHVQAPYLSDREVKLIVNNIMIKVSKALSL